MERTARPLPDSETQPKTAHCTFFGIDSSLNITFALLWEFVRLSVSHWLSGL